MRRVLALLLAAGLLTTPALAAETPAEETAARNLAGCCTGLMRTPVAMELNLPRAV